jgi:hypothetical protein
MKRRTLSDPTAAEQFASQRTVTPFASRISDLAALLLGAQLVVPAMAITKAQVSFNVANLPVLLAGCAAIIGASMTAAAHLVRVKIHREQTSLIAAIGGLLLVGGALQAGASTVWLWGAGSLLTGVGVGVAMLDRGFSWSTLRGLIVGPLVGVVLTSISWRAIGALALVNALLMLMVPASHRQLSGSEPKAEPNAEPSAELNSNSVDRSASVAPTSSAVGPNAHAAQSSAPVANTADASANRARWASGFIVLVSCAITFPAALFFVRNATILKESPLPIGLALAAGGLLGVWRGRILAARSLARRSIRQGAWLVLIFGVGGGQLLRDSFSGPIPIVLAFVVSFGGTRIVTSAVSVCASNTPRTTRRKAVLVPIFAGLLLGVIPLATAGHESLFWQVRELKQSYPTAASFKTLDRGILSLPASFDVAQDPRVGALSGPIRSAANFMTRQHVALALLFSSGIAALLSLLASFALPRQRRRPRDASAKPTSGSTNPKTTTPNIAVGAEA